MHLLHPDSVYKKLKTLPKNAELPLIGFHNFRHVRNPRDEGRRGWQDLIGSAWAYRCELQARHLCAQYANSILLRRVKFSSSTPAKKEKRTARVLCVEVLAMPRYPHPAPDKRACRSSDGICELRAASTRSEKIYLFNTFVYI